MLLCEAKFTSAMELVFFSKLKSSAPCLVVAVCHCQAGNTGHGSQMTWTGTTLPTGDNGEPRAEGFYLYLV